MNWLRVVVISLTVLVAFHRPAGADAYQWVASDFRSDIAGLHPSDPNVLYRTPGGFPVFGPLDLAQGGTYHLSSNSLSGMIPIVLNSDPPGSGPFTCFLDQHHMIDSIFSFRLGLQPPPGDPGPFQAPTVGVVGHVTGDIQPL